MKIITVLKFLSLVSIIFLSGCASEPQTGSPSNKTWYQFGISDEQTKRDLAVCQYESLVNGQSYSPIPAATAGQAIALGMLASSSENNRENEIIQTCMIAKGYSLVNTNSPLLTNSQTSQPQDRAITAEAEADIKAKAEKGDAGWQFTLGFCYFYGKGVPQDYVGAAKWFHKAADQGLLEAQYTLGACYAKGEGVPQNDLEAYIWFNLAATQGDKESARARDIEASFLSREDISEGQRRAAAFVPRPTLP
jgi:hypothetical protein